jgi:hypothetical protein
MAVFALLCVARANQLFMQAPVALPEVAPVVYPTFRAPSQVFLRGAPRQAQAPFPALSLVVGVLGGAAAALAVTGRFAPQGEGVSRVSELLMSNRRNLKKEKRLRNRMNAFRFKKRTFGNKRFQRRDYAKEAAIQEEDNMFYSLIFTATAEEARMLEQEEKEKAKQERQSPQKQAA